MESQPPVEKKNNKIFIIIGVVVVICLCVAVVSVAALAILVPAIQKTSQQVEQQVQPLQQENGYAGIADQQLQSDVLTAITGYEAKQNNCSDVTLASGKVLDLTPNRTSADPWVETWQINACGTSHLYSITFTPSPQGGTDYSVKQLDK